MLQFVCRLRRGVVAAPLQHRAVTAPTSAAAAPPPPPAAAAVAAAAAVPCLLQSDASSPHQRMKLDSMYINQTRPGCRCGCSPCGCSLCGSAAACCCTTAAAVSCWTQQQQQQQQMSHVVQQDVRCGTIEGASVDGPTTITFKKPIRKSLETCWRGAYALWHAADAASN
jgi:hypothetical protein